MRRQPTFGGRSLWRKPRCRWNDFGTLWKKLVEQLSPTPFSSFQANGSKKKVMQVATNCDYNQVQVLEELFTKTQSTKQPCKREVNKCLSKNVRSRYKLLLFSFSNASLVMTATPRYWLEQRWRIPQWPKFRRPHFEGTLQVGSKWLSYRTWAWLRRPVSPVSPLRATFDWIVLPQDLLSMCRRHDCKIASLCVETRLKKNRFPFKFTPS